MTTNTIIPKTRRPSLREKMIAANPEGQETIVTSYVGSQGEAVKMTHKASSLVTLYFSTVWGWESRAIIEDNVAMNLHFGARVNCGDCEGDCSPDPYSPTPNACPGREPFATYRCPDCARIFYDFESRVVHPDMRAPLQDESEEKNAIKEDLFTQSTPATRLKAAVEAHIARYHPGTAQRLGVKDADGGHG